MLRRLSPSLTCELLQVRQLDATVLSLKQHRQQSQSSLVKALEQENASLKQELEAQKELAKVLTNIFLNMPRVCQLQFFLHVVRVFQGCEAGPGHAELESLQQENEALRTQMARLSTQLLEVGHGGNFSLVFLLSLIILSVDILHIFLSQLSYSSPFLSRHFRLSWSAFCLRRPTGCRGDRIAEKIPTTCRYRAT